MGGLVLSCSEGAGGMGQVCASCSNEPSSPTFLQVCSFNIKFLPWLCIHPGGCHPFLSSEKGIRIHSVCELTVCELWGPDVRARNQRQDPKSEGSTGKAYGWEHSGRHMLRLPGDVALVLSSVLSLSLSLQSFCAAVPPRQVMYNEVLRWLHDCT